jgi:hypothetical protein
LTVGPSDHKMICWSKLNFGQNDFSPARHDPDRSIPGRKTGEDPYTVNFAEDFRGGMIEG